MLRSTPCPEEPLQATSRRGVRLEARTTAMQRCIPFARVAGKRQSRNR